MAEGSAGELEFDPYTGADRSELLNLMRAFCREDGHEFVATTAERGLVQLERSDALARLWLIRRSGEIIGYLCVTLGFSLEVGGADFIIDELFVVPAARGAGVGTCALDFAERESRALGAERILLEVEFANQRARQLYEARGYTAHERHLMSKPLGGR